VNIAPQMTDIFLSHFTAAVSANLCCSIYMKSILPTT